MVDSNLQAPISEGDEDMLKGIDSLISPELLHILAGMGHGDELAVV